MVLIIGLVLICIVAIQPSQPQKSLSYEEQYRNMAEVAQMVEECKQVDIERGKR